MFIEIKGRIHDTEKLEREQLLQKKALQYEFHEILSRHGFKKTGKGYTHEEFLLECTISFKEQQDL